MNCCEMLDKIEKWIYDESIYDEDGDKIIYLEELKDFIKKLRKEGG